jgi:hypothetical protein
MYIIMDHNSPSSMIIIFFSLCSNNSQNFLVCGDVFTFLVGTKSENHTRYDDTSLTLLDKLFQNSNDPIFSNYSMVSRPSIRVQLFYGNWVLS